MRTGFLGAAAGNAEAIKLGAEYLLFTVNVDKLVYLASGNEFDAGIQALAEQVLGGPATLAERWERTLALAREGASPERIEDEWAREQQLQKVRVSRCLAAGELRSLDMLGERLVVMAASKDALLEVDFQEAELIVYGDAPVALVRRVGKRTFIAPGPLGSGSNGVLVCDCEADGVTRITISDSAGNASTTLELAARPPARSMTSPGLPSASERK
jgi:hypothetical protein